LNNLNESIVIRRMLQADGKALSEAFFDQGWNKSEQLFDFYFSEQENGKMDVLVVEVDEKLAGYVTLIPKALVGPYSEQGYPEIGDLNVLMKFQRRGVGNSLMDAAESLASEISDAVTLAVGIHSGYGNAQRMYVKRGYIFDGTGAWYHDEPLKQYEACRNDDFLCLYMKKDFRAGDSK